MPKPEAAARAKIIRAHCSEEEVAESDARKKQPIVSLDGTFKPRGFRAWTYARQKHAAGKRAIDMCYSSL